MKNDQSEFLETWEELNRDKILTNRRPFLNGFAFANIRIHICSSIVIADKM